MVSVFGQCPLDSTGKCIQKFLKSHNKGGGKEGSLVNLVLIPILIKYFRTSIVLSFLSTSGPHTALCIQDCDQWVRRAGGYYLYIDMGANSSPLWNLAKNINYHFTLVGVFPRG